MARFSSSALTFCLFVLLLVIVVSNPCVARHQNGRYLFINKDSSNSDGLVNEERNRMYEVPRKLVAGPGVVRSHPASPMPSYTANSAPVPLPEFPTLGPPMVWSFPAAPLPSLEAPPPDGIPVLPGHRDSRTFPSVPVVAAEPVTSPGYIAAPPGPVASPDAAPEPTPGGPLPHYRSRHR